MKTEELDTMVAAEKAKYARFDVIDRQVLGTSNDVQPAVMLAGEEGGSVARATGATPCEWFIHAEDEGRGGIHLTIGVDNKHTATITVHAPDGVNPWDEAQNVGAALVWSRIRGVLRDRARLKFDAEQVIP